MTPSNVDPHSNTRIVKKTAPVSLMPKSGDFYSFHFYWARQGRRPHVPVFPYWGRHSEPQQQSRLNNSKGAKQELVNCH